MAVANYVEYNPADRTYRLPKEHAPLLSDEEASPMFMGGMFQLLVPMIAAAPKVAVAFQTGKPVSMYDFSQIYTRAWNAHPHLHSGIS
jgi:hypothetical protein